MMVRTLLHLSVLKILIFCELELENTRPRRPENNLVESQQLEVWEMADKESVESMLLFIE